MPKTLKGEVRPYSIAAHGGDPKKTRATRAVKRHTRHAIRVAEKLRGKVKRATKADCRATMKEERDDVALAHLHPRCQQDLIVKMLPSLASQGDDLNPHTVRIKHGAGGLFTAA